ncbi:MAG: radical SAM protein, partial [Acidobacteria bacterium]|nr:radical SAM protein [Acidobacteriota bacterium]
MTTFSRRDLLKTGALTAAALPIVDVIGLASFAAPAPEEVDPWLGLKIGVATYTVRELPIEEAIKAVQRVGLKYVSIKNVKNHIDLSHTPEERKQRAQMFRDAGLIPLSVGNVGMKNDEADIRRAFEYAR